MPVLTLAALGNLLKRIWPYLAIAAAVGLALLLAYCAGGKGEVVKQQGRTIKTQQQVGKADDKAADTRVDDAVRVEQQKQELRDALKNATSGDDARRRGGCAVLVQQGRDVSAVPACRGL